MPPFIVSFFMCISLCRAADINKADFFAFLQYSARKKVLVTEPIRYNLTRTEKTQQGTWPVKQTSKECCGRSTCKVSEKFGDYVTVEQCQTACEVDPTCLFMEFGNLRSDEYNRCKGNKCRCYLAWECGRSKTHKGYNIYTKPLPPDSVRRRTTRCSSRTRKTAAYQQSEKRCTDSRGDFACYVSSSPSGYTTECKCSSGWKLDSSASYCRKECDSRRRKYKNDFASCLDSNGFFTCHEENFDEVMSCTCPAGYAPDTTGYRNGMSCKKLGSCDSSDLMKATVETEQRSCERSGGVFTCTKDVRNEVETECACPIGLVKRPNSFGCFQSTTTTTTTMTTSTTSATMTTSTTADQQNDRAAIFQKLSTICGGFTPSQISDRDFVLQGVGAAEAWGRCEKNGLGTLTCSPSALGPTSDYKFAYQLKCKCKGDMVNIPVSECRCPGSKNGIVQVREGYSCRDMTCSDFKDQQDICEGSGGEFRCSGKIEWDKKDLRKCFCPAGKINDPSYGSPCVEDIAFTSAQTSPVFKNLSTICGGFTPSQISDRDFVLQGVGAAEAWGRCEKNGLGTLTCSPSALGPTSDYKFAYQLKCKCKGDMVNIPVSECRCPGSKNGIVQVREGYSCRDMTCSDFKDQQDICEGSGGEFRCSGKIEWDKKDLRKCFCPAGKINDPSYGSPCVEDTDYTSAVR
eukprot:TRINITY_DN1696_c0_g1_i1.p1 TRINITY_DN1696_c0_g1~~TRINITY_DN1696_c0_g1_i1.p1  ORF type:complete len:686 (+),score=40.98 TRINITY_DN1696_c0_g1_i1:117-2174(+)